ncbi:ras guanine nucleotide exchange factor domain-containing protein [Amylostereum chailletii]|nr:ras guanine nucleotide exchange factor domain-containing protein [Amylostereum chailletii]
MQCCKEIRNFHCLVAIVNALAYSDLSLVPNSEMPISVDDQKILDELVPIVTHFTHSQKSLRELTAEQGRPLAPFMPTYLKCLERELNGKPQEFKSRLTGNRIININSFSSATKCIREMERWHLPFPWAPNDTIRSWISEQLDPFMLDESDLDALKLETFRPLCKQLKQTAGEGAQEGGAKCTQEGEA